MASAGRLHPGAQERQQITHDCCPSHQGRRQRALSHHRQDQGLAGRQVATLPIEKRAEIVDRLESLNNQLNLIVKTNEGRSGIFELDAAFHRAIVESRAGPRLKALHKAVEPQTERYWRLYASSIMPDLHLSIAEHAGIIKAIKNGDADRIERALQINWENGLLRLATVMEMFGERGRH